MKSPKATAAFLLKSPVKLRFQAKQFQTKQRRKTFAKRGEETGLKALSQPTGTRACDCDCSGATRGGNSCCQAIGFAVGRRSPLSARFTEATGMEVNPTPVVDNEGKETRLAVTNANATAATRNDHMLRIGVSPKSRQPPKSRQSPCPDCARPFGPRSIKNVATRARFRNALRNSPCRDTAHTCVMAPARCRNKHSGRALSCGPAIPSPSPRDWPAIVGAADGPISCVLIFILYPPRAWGLRGAKRAQKRRWPGQPGHDATEENYRKIRPSAAARADAPCGRRTAPDWQPRRPPPAETAWR